MPHRRRTIAVLLAFCVLGATVFAGSPVSAGTSTEPLQAKKTQVQSRQQHAAAVSWLRHKAQRFQHLTWDWQRLTGQPLAKPVRNLAGSSIEALQLTVREWQHRASKARLQASHVPHKTAWLCIHGYEGSWPDAKNPDYFGGLQMDKYFEAAYGAWLVLKYGGHIAIDSRGHKYAVGGHAYLWTPLEQMWAAERAYKSRGFGPWPNTARYCGLL